MIADLKPHWALYLMDKAYVKDGRGPDKFDCLGLMEYVFHMHKGVVLPVSAIRLGEANNEEAIRAAAKASGLRPAFDLPQEDDLLLMNNSEGPHVGMVIRTNGKLSMLHALDGIGVCHTPLTDLSFLGFKNIRAWRIDNG